MDPREDVLYREIILENWRHPSNHGIIQAADFDLERDNPLCGDRIRLTGKVTGGHLTDIAFAGEGCAVSIASASLLTEEIKGRAIKDIQSLDAAQAMQALGVQLTPARTKCALLAYRTLTDALTQLANSPKS